MMFLIQGQLDPLMQGQRKANLKYQSSMGISGVSARHIYGVIGWFRIDFFCNVTYSEEEVLDGSGAIVLSKLVLTSRASAASACSSLVFISASGVAAISC